MSVKERVDAILTENIGKVLSLDLAFIMSAQIVESVLMTRELAGLPEEPGKSTNLEFRKSEKGKKVIMATGKPAEETETEPKPELEDPHKLAKALEPPLPRAKAIESRPFEGFDPSRDPEDQPDTMPITIRRGRKP